MLLVGAWQRGKQEQLSRIKSVHLFCGDFEYRYDDIFAAFCVNRMYRNATDCDVFVQMIVLNAHVHDEKRFIFMKKVGKISKPLHIHEIKKK